jgi:membrane protein implicated in regulation of membrane protease activity
MKNLFDFELPQNENQKRWMILGGVVGGFALLLTGLFPLVWLVQAYFAGVIAKSRGRDPWPWAIAAVFFSLLVVLLIPTTDKPRPHLDLARMSQTTEQMLEEKQQQQKQKEREAIAKIAQGEANKKFGIFIISILVFILVIGAILSNLN